MRRPGGETGGIVARAEGFAGGMKSRASKCRPFGLGIPERGPNVASASALASGCAQEENGWKGRGCKRVEARGEWMDGGEGAVQAGALDFLPSNRACRACSGMAATRGMDGGAMTI